MHIKINEPITIIAIFVITAQLIMNMPQQARPTSRSKVSTHAILMH
jgi:hypothetical protein